MCQNSALLTNRLVESKSARLASVVIDTDKSGAKGPMARLQIDSGPSGVIFGSYQRRTMCPNSYGIVKLTLSERTYRVELTSFALIGRHRLPPARR